MKRQKDEAYCLVVTGDYANENAAEHALRDPFIEEQAERTGRFRIHQLTSLMVAPGVAMGQLSIEQTGDGEFLITSNDPDHPLTARKAAAVAEALRYQAMFDSITIEPLEPAEI